MLRINKTEMQLKMFIGEKLIDVAEINLNKVSSPGYIHSLKMQLEADNEEVLDLSEEQPQYFIDHVPSLMNNTKYFLKN